jgi:ABC-type multidrug transport system permease subunit
MKRFWILFKTEFKVWGHDPITALGGILPPFLIFTAFALLFGDRLSFQIAVLNHDQGNAGQILMDTFSEVISPLDNNPYYDVVNMPETEAWAAYNSQQIEAIWVIPADFSARLASGDNPTIEMHFTNYNDDRAKNHRIYAAEVLWRFYEKIGQPAPPLPLAETYPRPEMVSWVPIIGVGIILLSATLGGIFNMFALTFKEKSNHIILEFGLAPRSLAWVFLPKTVLALIMSLASSTIFIIIIGITMHYWPGQYVWAVWLLAGLTSLFWIGIALLVGLWAKNYMGGALLAVLGTMIIFFIGGGLEMVRFNIDNVLWLAWLFPNTHAVDPMRDMILFHSWPVDWTAVLLKLSLFATFGLMIGMAVATRKIRRLG